MIHHSFVQCFASLVYFGTKLSQNVAVVAQITVNCEVFNTFGVVGLSNYMIEQVIADRTCHVRVCNDHIIR